MQPRRRTAGEARPLLVPLDGSRAAEAALPIAQRLAVGLGAPLRVLRVEAPEGDSGDAAEQREFERYVAGLLNLQGGWEHAWSATLAYGEAAERILAESRKASLVVLTSYGDRGVQSVLWGSVADRVVRTAAVPVLVVPGPGRQRLSGGPILVCLDGSPVAETGLGVAREVGAAVGLPLVLLRAWEAVPSPREDLVARGIEPAREGVAHADAYLAGVHRPGEEYVAMTGPVLAAIRQASDRLDASIVVLTSQGEGSAGHSEPGSAMEAVRHSLPRPILIVPAPQPNRQTSVRSARDSGRSS